MEAALRWVTDVLIAHFSIGTVRSRIFEYTTYHRKEKKRKRERKRKRNIEKLESEEKYQEAHAIDGVK